MPLHILREGAISRVIRKPEYLIVIFQPFTTEMGNMAYSAERKRDIPGALRLGDFLFQKKEEF